MNYILLDSFNKNHFTAIVDGAWKSFLMHQALQEEKDFLPIVTVDTVTYQTKEGNVVFLSVQPLGTDSPNDIVIMITAKPDNMTLGRAYELIGE